MKPLTPTTTGEIEMEIACEGWPVNDGTAMEPGDLSTAWHVQ